MALEDALPASDWCTDPVELVAPIAALRKPGGPVDPDVAQAMRSLESTGRVRRGKDIDKVTKALGVNLVCSLPRLRDEELKKVVVASRQVLSNCPSIGISVDAKRFGGKHWLAGVISSGTHKTVSVTNLVVRHGGVGGRRHHNQGGPAQCRTSENRRGGGGLTTRSSEVRFFAFLAASKNFLVERVASYGGF